MNEDFGSPRSHLIRLVSLLVRMLLKAMVNVQWRSHLILSVSLLVRHEAMPNELWRWPRALVRKAGLPWVACLLLSVPLVAEVVARQHRLLLPQLGQIAPVLYPLVIPMLVVQRDHLLHCWPEAQWIPVEAR